jgi:hypothetical protein
MRFQRALAVALALAGSGCGRDRPQVSAEEAVLERQVAGLQALVAAAERGPLIPFREVLVVLDQRLVQDLLTSAMPFERVVAGRYRIRVTDARVHFDDGFALVQVDGRASLADRPDRNVFAEVSVFGGLNTMELDPGSGTLRARVDVVAFEVRRLAVLGVDAPEDLIEDLGRQQLEAFAVLLSRFDVPVRLDRDITIPGVTGEVTIAPARLPLALSVQDVKALRGRLWVSVAAATEARPPASPSATPAPGTPERAPARDGSPAPGRAPARP